MPVLVVDNCKPQKAANIETYQQLLSRVIGIQMKYVLWRGWLQSWATLNFKESDTSGY